MKTISNTRIILDAAIQYVFVFQLYNSKFQIRKKYIGI